jgi:hypothetical protein
MRPFQKEMVDSVARSIRQRQRSGLRADRRRDDRRDLSPLENRQAARSLFTRRRPCSRTPRSGSEDAQRRRLPRPLHPRQTEDGAHTEIICHEDFCPRALLEKMEKSGLLSRITTDEH